MFGIGVWAQGDGDGGILEQIHGAMEFDRGRLDGMETTRKEVSERIVEGKRTPILNDETFEFAQGLPGFKTEHFHGQLAHDVTQGGAEKLGTARFSSLVIEGFIGRLDIPQGIEIAM